MEHDWIPTAVAICNGSAALAKAFLNESDVLIKGYLLKKGMVPTQLKVDIEGFRFGVRVLDGLGSKDLNVPNTSSYGEDKPGHAGGSAPTEGDKKKKKKHRKKGKKN
jgi:hypothetical protein